MAKRGFPALDRPPPATASPAPPALALQDSLDTLVCARWLGRAASGSSGKKMGAVGFFMCYGRFCVTSPNLFCSAHPAVQPVGCGRFLSLFHPKRSSEIQLTCFKVVCPEPQSCGVR